MISGFIELMAYGFWSKLDYQMLIQLSSQFSGSSAMLSSHNAFNARQSLSVSLEVCPELLRVLKVFMCFLNSVLVLDMEALEKTSN